MLLTLTHHKTKEQRATDKLASVASLHNVINTEVVGEIEPLRGVPMKRRKTQRKRRA